ncbi:MAG: glucosaminidase [Corynebacteriales bacterium]|nr:glucosaminidase [Mycobacteriales bacterium]
MYLRRSLQISAWIILALTIFPSAAHADPNSDFVEHAGGSAKASQWEYGVPSSVTVAQAILESGWGKSGLAVNENNYFGIKCRDGIPGPIAIGCAEYPTKECDAQGCYDTTGLFRKYASIEDSFRDHGRFLFESPRYAAAFNYSHDADQFVREIHAAGYATDPDYSNKVIRIMQQQDLYRFNY